MPFSILELYANKQTCFRFALNSPSEKPTYFPRVMRELYRNYVVDAGGCIAMMGVDARNCIIMMGVDAGSCIIMTRHTPFYRVKYIGIKICDKVELRIGATT